MLKELIKNAPNFVGGGYEKVPLTKKSSKIGGQCSPSMHEGWCQAR